jgi:hypothetical protein
MSTEDLNDLRMSETVRPLYLAVKKHIEENVIPIQDEFYSIGEIINYFSCVWWGTSVIDRRLTVSIGHS